MKTVSRTRLRILALFAMAALFFSGCTSLPPPAEPKATVGLLGPSEVASPRFGALSESNPYLARTPLIGKPKEEFIVLQIDIALPANTQVSVAASALSGDGHIAAEVMSAEKLVTYGAAWINNLADSKTRERRIRSTYLPAQMFDAKAGTSTYYLVLMGKYPIPRPCSILCAVLFNGEIVSNNEFVLYDLPKQ
jgi:hypothetical protein